MLLNIFPWPPFDFQDRNSDPVKFIGIELIKDPVTLEPAPAETARIANRMKQLGVLMSTDGPFHNVLKIKPPIVFSRKDADLLSDTLERALAEICRDKP